MELISNLMEDMKEPVSYLPFGIMAGTAALLLLSGICRMVRKHYSYRQLFYFFLLFIYGTVLWIQAFFSREPGSRSGIDLALFSTWGTSWQSHAYVIENVIMFLPLGILLPAAVRRFSRMWIIFLISLGMSVSIELMQLVTSRGYCQMDDVVMNTLGGCIGYLTGKVFSTVSGGNNSK